MKKSEITAGIEYALLAPNAYEGRSAEKVRFTEAGLATAPGYKNQGKVLAEMFTRSWIGEDWAWRPVWVMPSFVRQPWAQYLTEREEQKAHQAQAMAKQIERDQRDREETELLRAFLADNKQQLAELGLANLYAYRPVVELKLSRGQLTALLEKVAR
jgi:hypothetical protein